MDGCKAGWFFFSFGDSSPEFGVVRRFADLFQLLNEDTPVLVDIPIGLPDEGSSARECDILARRVLSPLRRSSVFPTPSRLAILASDYEAASALNRQSLGKGLSKQSWAIAPKIREVDELLRSNSSLTERVREVHPEVCFWGLSGQPMLHSKKTRAGFLERLDVLTRVFPEAEDVVARAYLRHGGWEVQRDDVLDALVAAACATRMGECLTLPEHPPTDFFGIRMEMVYLPLQVS